jgi:casein kinase II subunit beta
MFCEVERSYIEDGFNLYGLRACVSNFSDCLDLILDRIGPDDSDDSHLTQSACTLYGLIHARYIITAHGLDAMYNKVRTVLLSILVAGLFVVCRSLAPLVCDPFHVLQYAAKEFGTCPLAQCQGQPVLPVGLKDEMGADTVKIFCPKCQCVYHPPPIRSRSSSHHGAGSSGVDGAAFGTTFPHLFLMTFSNLVPDPLPPNSAYVPRVFGFRVHMSARQRTPSTAAVAAAAAAEPKSKTISEKMSRSNKSQEVKVKAEETEPAAKKPEETVHGAADTVKSLPEMKSPAAESINGESKDAASPQIAKSAKTSGSNKRRSSDGEDNSSTANVKKEGNGFLVDNTAAKRRKRNDG